MSSSGTRIGLVLAALLLAVTACQAGTPQARTSPKPTASASPSASVDAQRCARLAKLGFVVCPPSADKIQVPPTTVKNATDGAVDDATAQKWGHAFQLAEGYYQWAMQTNARDALTSGAFADPGAASNLFASDLRDLDEAKKQGGVLAVQFEQIPRIQLVAVPGDLQDSMRRQNLKPQPYGWAAEFAGPAKWSIRLPNGSETTIDSADSNYRGALLVWGEFKVDPDLGAIWYESGLYGCNGPVKSVCRL